MTLIDRHPSHALVWSYITTVMVLLILTIVIAAHYDADHERRIKALEDKVAVQK